MICCKGKPPGYFIQTKTSQETGIVELSILEYFCVFFATSRLNGGFRFQLDSPLHQCLCIYFLITHTGFLTKTTENTDMAFHKKTVLVLASVILCLAIAGPLDWKAKSQRWRSPASPPASSSATTTRKTSTTTTATTVASADTDGGVTIPSGNGGNNGELLK